MPTCGIGVIDVGGKVPRLVVLLPLYGGAVVVVGVHVVVVGVHAGEQRAAGRTAHGRGHERVVEVRPLAEQQVLHFGHVVQGSWGGIKKKKSVTNDHPTEHINNPPPPPPPP